MKIQIRFQELSTFWPKQKGTYGFNFLAFLSLSRIEDLSLSFSVDDGWCLSPLAGVLSL